MMGKLNPFCNTDEAYIFWSDKGNTPMDNSTMESYKKLLAKTDELVKAKFVEMFGDPVTNSKYLRKEKLGEITTVQRGGSPRPISDYITTDENGLNWIKIGDANTGRYIIHTEEKIKPEGLRKTRQVYSGDLLLSNSMSFGRPYILKIDGCIHDGWLVIHFDEKILNAIYLQTYFSLPSTYSMFESMAAGGVVNNLNSEIVQKLPVLIPSIERQKDIEDFILINDESKSAIQASLDSLTQVYKKIIAENLGGNE